MAPDLFASLFEPRELRAFTISELTAGIDRSLSKDFTGITVEGEIAGFNPSRAGHWYFSLHDAQATIQSVCFRNENFRIRFRPEDGMQVRCFGSVTFYGKSGRCQLVIDSMEPIGEGAKAAAFERLKARLAAEGIFDVSIKRPIPEMPRCVGVVTSAGGAAVHDIFSTMRKRAPGVPVILVPTSVQGEFAAGELADAIMRANRFAAAASPAGGGIDVLIVGRGGGAAEDLHAFNDERLARAIRASSIPVISAVGHETDWSIADLAADSREATPTAAAERVSRAYADLSGRVASLASRITAGSRERLRAIEHHLSALDRSRGFTRFPFVVGQQAASADQLAGRLASAINGSLTDRRSRILQASARLSPAAMAAKVANNRQRLELSEARSRAAIDDLLASTEASFARNVAKLDALSPLNVLSRGYSLTRKPDGSIVSDPHQIEVGERVNIRLANGSFDAEVVDRQFGDADEGAGE